MSETGPRHHPAETVPQALGRLRVALEDAFLQTSRTLGLTAQQAELLCAAMAPAAVGELAQALRCDRSNVSHLVDRAAARGLVNRRIGDEDGRVTVVTLTAEGERLAQRFIAELEAQTRPLRAPDAPYRLAGAALPRPGRLPSRLFAPVPGPLAAPSPHLSEHHGHPH